MTTKLDTDLAYQISDTLPILESIAPHDLEIEVKNSKQAEITGILSDTSVFCRIQLGDPIEVTLSRLSDNTNTHTCLSEALAKIRIATDHFLAKLEGQHRGLHTASKLEYHIQNALHLAETEVLKDPDEYLEEQLWKCLEKATALKEAMQKFYPLKEKEEEIAKRLGFSPEATAELEELTKMRAAPRWW